MRDTNFYSHDAAVAADAMATTEFHIEGTPAGGLWLQYVIKRNHSDADETLDITVYGKATATVANTDKPVAILPQIANADVANGATIIRYLLVQTPLAYINSYLNVGGTTPSWDVSISVVSGPDQKATANLS